jgi:hypothetical protein
LISKTSHACLLLALLTIFLGRIVSTYRVFNDTTDEHIHIRSGIEILQKGSYTVDPQHPPIPRIFLGLLPYYVGKLNLGEHNLLWTFGLWEWKDAAYYWRTLALARAGNLVFALLLFAYAYRWSSLLYGPWAGLAAAALVACCPNLIAHASVATTDAGAAATLLVATYYLWRWSRQPGLLCLAAAVASSVAVLSKFSALFFLPPIAFLYLLVARGPRWLERRPLRLEPAVVRVALGRSVACGLIFMFLLWAAYLFQARGHLEKGHHEPQMVSKLERLVPSNAWIGVKTVLGHNEEGHLAYLLGDLSKAGWWYYFLVVLGVKTTLPLLLLVALAAGLYLGRCYGGAARQTGYLWIAVVVVLGICMASRINIGVRHILVLYAFFAVLASGVFADAARLVLRRPAIRCVALAAVAWHAGESVVAHPDYLAYFNQIARGREERFLADSNLDWGQDLARLGEYLRSHDIHMPQADLFGPTPPYKLGFLVGGLHPLHPQPGWVVISVNHLLGINRSPQNYQWFRQRRPDARVGKSIRLYYLPAAP